MKIQFEWTIPNILSLVRLALIPVFALLYLMSETQPELLYWAIAVLVLSGLSDALDGIIARKFNQISEAGKILDPAADKLTQVVVLVCLTVRNHTLIPLLVICFVKELLQLIGGVILIRKRAGVEASHWCGKVATFVFYGVMAIFLFAEPPAPIAYALLILVAVLMIYAFVHYARVFVRLRREDADAVSVECNEG